MQVTKNKLKAVCVVKASVGCIKVGAGWPGVCHQFDLLSEDIHQ